MSTQDSTALTLRFSKSGGSGYRVEVDGGTATSLAAGEVLSLLSGNSTKNRDGHRTSQDAKSSSRQLFDALVQQGILTRFTSARNEALSTGKTVCLRLEFEGAKELDDLPWELLADPESTRDFLLVRSVQAPCLPRESTLATSLRVLAVAANPTDLPPFDFDLKWEILRQALQRDVEAGRISMERLEEASEAGLNQALAQQQFQAIHFVGYGRSNVRASYGSLYLEDQDKRSRSMTAEYLTGLLRRHAALRLVVLDVGSNTAELNPFAETARTLARSGLDAAIAMRRRLSGPAAVAFHQELYSSLASGIAIGQSVVNARRTLARCSPEVEWDAPMLYTSLDAGAVITAYSPKDESAKVRELDAANEPVSATSPSSEERSTTLPTEPEERPSLTNPSRPTRTRKILMLAASPESLTRLRLDEEAREIRAGLQEAKYRGRFQLEQRWAVRTRDLQQAMLEVDPQIVHFCGHGAGPEGLILEDDNGLPRPVPGHALAHLFQIFSGRVECVVLNSCHTAYQAEAIAKYIPFVVGMKKQIPDSAAINFATGFYRALGAGYPFDFAYRLGCNAIEIGNLPDPSMAVLLTHPTH